MEYVKVRFPTDRLVYIDDEENGSTNEVLRVDAGTHVFTLGNLANYRPASRKVEVKGTTALEPMEITFLRKDA
jgi:PEGA domain